VETSYEKAVRGAMAMSEEEMLRLVSTKSAVLFCGCANCSGGQQEADRKFDFRRLDRVYQGEWACQGWPGKTNRRGADDARLQD